MKRCDIPINALLVMRGLRAGKSPKEIAMLLGCSCWGIWKFIERHLEVRTIYVETYLLRYPHKEGPPDKIKIAVQ